jgi:hypothetical protein
MPVYWRTHMMAKECPKEGRFSVQTSGSIGDLRDEAMSSEPVLEAKHIVAPRKENREPQAYKSVRSCDSAWWSRHRTDWE